MPNRNDSTNLEVAQATANPIASPAAPSANTSRSTIQTILRRSAPSAMRMPISFVRRATAYAIVPYSPTQAIASASTAKHAQR